MKTPWYPDVGLRQLQPELMDQPGLDVNIHRAALSAIAGINSLAFTHRAYWKAIRPLLERRPSNPVRVLDVACGSGDVAVRLATLAQRAGLPIIVDGCDRSPIAVSLAQERAELSQVPSRFFRFDVLNEEWPADYDVITTSLFLHHLRNDEAVHVLRQTANGSRQRFGSLPHRISPGTFWCATFNKVSPGALRCADLCCRCIHSHRANRAGSLRRDVRCDILQMLDGPNAA